MPDDVDQLLARAQDGDKTVLPALRKAFESAPDLWDQAGDLALQAECALVKMAVGDSEVHTEALRTKLAQLRDELAGSQATALELLLANRVALCWLMVHYADATYAQRTHEGTLSLELGDYFQRRQDRAHRRYLTALKALAQVRRLLGPTVQVNIAKQQVNVAQ